MPHALTLDSTINGNTSDCTLLRATNLPPLTVILPYPGAHTSSCTDVHPSTSVKSPQIPCSKPAATLAHLPTAPHTSTSQSSGFALCHTPTIIGNIASGSRRLGREEVGDVVDAHRPVGVWVEDGGAEGEEGDGGARAGRVGVRATLHVEVGGGEETKDTGGISVWVDEVKHEERWSRSEGVKWRAW